MLTTKVKVEEIDINDNPVYALTLIDSEFSDITYHYGEVKFLEDEPNDRATLAFEYVIIEGTEPTDPETKERFQKAVGDVLIDMITHQVENRELVFKGGTDSEE